MSTTISKAGRVVFDIGGIDKLNKGIEKVGRMHVRVGILQRTSGRKEGEINNAELGVIHEFGVVGGFVSHPSREKERAVNRTWNQFRDQVQIPARSFLRVPLLQYLPDAIKELGEQKWREIIEKDGLVEALKQLGLLGEMVVDDAFATGGYGEWKPLAKSTVRRKLKKGGKGTEVAILIDKGELRQAITSGVFTGRA